MTTETTLQTRAASKCELCEASENLAVFAVSPRDDSEADDCALLCATCSEQASNPEKLDVHHWRCLTTSAWSQTPAVQVLAWRMLNHLRGEGWAQELLETLYLEDETLVWAKDGFAVEGEGEEAAPKHLDANGAELVSGDAVTLIKDLNVKGAGFTAKRGTVVRSISLVADNPKHIEGRVNSQQIVILTEFVKKSN